MKRIVRLAIFVLVAFFLISYYRTSGKEHFSRWINYSFCDRPIKYRIGGINEKFGLSENDFKENIFQAGDIWNKVVNKSLFEYSSEGGLTINLVDDGRQEIVTTINKITSNVEQQKESIEVVNQNFQNIKTQLEKDANELNDQINYWNDKGGAPKDVYEKLVDTQNQIQSRADQLNEYGETVNQTVQFTNSQIDNLNSKVNTFNSLISVTPEVGVYTSGINKIDIFFYGSKEELIHVLSHELGHALGLAHVQAEEAIMNPKSSSNLTPIQADIDEITAFCANKSRVDLIKNDLYNFSYSFVSQFQQLY